LSQNDVVGHLDAEIDRLERERNDALEQVSTLTNALKRLQLDGKVSINDIRKAMGLEPWSSDDSDDPPPPPDPPSPPRCANDYEVQHTKDREEIERLRHDYDELVRVAVNIARRAREAK
jgi:hypothetical protein